MLVVGVAPDSPAEPLGMLVGDILIGFDGQPVASPDRLLDALTGGRVGRAVPLRVQRGGTAVDLEVQRHGKKRERQRRPQARSTR